MNVLSHGLRIMRGYIFYILGVWSNMRDIHRPFYPYIEWGMHRFYSKCVRKYRLFFRHNVPQSD